MGPTISNRITFVDVSLPKSGNLNDELQWFGASLGLVNIRDKDKSMFRIFIELIKAAKSRIPMSSDEVAESLNLSRGTVIHHINKLISSGIVVAKNNRYILRVDNLKQLISELERDLNETCRELKAVAEDIDRRLGI